jgi:DNA-binding MarR family transcriptional regulator
MALANGTKTTVHPPTAAEAAFRSLIRAFGLLERALHVHFQSFGISGSQWGVLRNLHRAEQAGEGGLRLTDLGQRLLVRPPSVTGIVGRLEQAGLVRRAGVPGDLRAKRVALTSEGRSLVERVLEVHTAKVAAVMSALTGDEQKHLHRLLTRLCDSLELPQRTDA